MTLSSQSTKQFGRNILKVSSKVLPHQDDAICNAQQSAQVSNVVPEGSDHIELNIDKVIGEDIWL